MATPHSDPFYLIESKERGENPADYEDQTGSALTMSSFREVALLTTSVTLVPGFLAMATKQPFHKN